jgi:O-antigen ligase
MRPHSRSSRPPEPSALQAFRGDLRTSAKLHPLETTLMVVVGALLCFTPWALGSMTVWSQFVSLGLGVLAFTVALINRHYRGELAPNGDFKLIIWPKLIHFPLFWLGLLFLGYILIQALNPAWVYVSDGKAWWLQRIPNIAWLPAGMDTPFKDSNAWRELMIYGTAWLLVCALWVGVTRRVTIQGLLTTVAVNGAVLAIIGILQKVTHAQYILWGLKDVTPAGYFFSTIIYKNHAGAYFNLVLMLTTALLYWHFSRAERRMERSSPAPVFAFCTVLLGLSVLLTNSRAATILMMLFTLLAFIGFIIRCTITRSEGRSPWAITLLCAVFALFIGLGSYFLNTDRAFDEAINRFNNLMEKGAADSSVASRNLARKATLEMAEDNLITGWGAGSFRHYFPVYQRHYPEIYSFKHGKSERIFRWEFAHNDYVQFLAEMGLIGVGLLLAILACTLRHLLKQRVFLRPHLVFILMALLVTAAHAWVDFQFHNPAILFLWCASAALAARWAELEARNAPRA